MIEYRPSDRSFSQAAAALAIKNSKNFLCTIMHTVVVPSPSIHA